MNYQTFKAQNLGKLVDDGAGYYKGECVSLVKRWILFNGWPMKMGNAIDWQHNGDNFYQWIPNTPSGVPIQGDMVVFNYKPYGHIGICETAGVNTINLLNQNFPKGNDTDPVQITSFNYTHVLGWLRPKQTNKESMKHLRNIRFSNGADVYMLYVAQTMEEVNATGRAIDLWNPPRLERKVGQAEVSFCAGINSFESVAVFGLKAEDTKDNSDKQTIDGLNGKVSSLSASLESMNAGADLLDKEIEGLNTKVADLQSQLTACKKLTPVGNDQEQQVQGFVSKAIEFLSNLFNKK